MIAYCVYMEKISGSFLNAHRSAAWADADNAMGMAAYQTFTSDARRKATNAPGPQQSPRALLVMPLFRRGAKSAMLTADTLTERSLEVRDQIWR